MRITCFNTPAEKPMVNAFSQLKPVSLTPDIDKTLEDTIATWIIEDIKPNLDIFHLGLLILFNIS